MYVLLHAPPWDAHFAQYSGASTRFLLCCRLFRSHSRQPLITPHGRGSRQSGVMAKLESMRDTCSDSASTRVQDWRTVSRTSRSIPPARVAAAAGTELVEHLARLLRLYTPVNHHTDRRETCESNPRAIGWQPHPRAHQGAHLLRSRHLTPHPSRTRLQKSTCASSREHVRHCAR